MLGLIFFVPMIALCLPVAWRSADRRIHLARLILSIVGVGMIIYLIIAEFFIIKAICLWCSGVHVITFILFVIIVTASPVVLAPGYGDARRLDDDADDYDPRRGVGASARRWLRDRHRGPAARRTGGGSPPRRPAGGSAAGGHPPKTGARSRLPGRPSPGNRTARFAWGAVVVILVAVVVLIVYALTDAPVTQLTVHRATTSSSVMAEAGQGPRSPSSTPSAAPPPTPSSWPPTGAQRSAAPQVGGQARGPLRGGRVLPVLRRGAVAADRGPVPVRPLQPAQEHAVGPALRLPRHPDLQLRGGHVHQPLPLLHRRGAVLGRPGRPGGLRPDRHPHARPRRRWCPATAVRVASSGRAARTAPVRRRGQPAGDVDLGVQPCAHRQRAPGHHRLRARPSRPIPSPRPSWPQPTS